MSYSAPARSLCAIVIVQVFSLSTAATAPPAIPLDDFLDPPSPPPRQTNPSTTPTKFPSFPPLLFIPSFQGTLLSLCSPHSCHPLHLQPQTYPSTPSLYHHLLSSSLQPHPHTHADYPTASCAPSPYSHIGHCHPLPAPGPIHHLIRYFNVRGVTMTTLPYDWRLETTELFRKGFVQRLQDEISSLRRDNSGTAGRVILLAHGTGCYVIRHALDLVNDAVWLTSNVATVICAAAVGAGSPFVRDALEEGNGILTAGGAHVYMDAMANARVEGRLDFRLMEFELGLRKGRGMGLGEVAGIWDLGDSMVDKDERIRLARGLASLKELGRQGEWGGAGGVKVVCLGGECGNGERAGPKDMGYFNLTESFGEVVLRMVQEKDAGRELDKKETIDVLQRKVMPRDDKGYAQGHR